MLIFLMFIYLAIHSHFSIVYKSFLIFQNVQILAQESQECISVHALNLNDLLDQFAALKHLFFLSISKESKNLNALSIVDHLLHKVMRVFVRTLIWHFTTML